jgi:hypothetical protein
MRTTKSIGFRRRGCFAIAFVHEDRRVTIETSADLWQARGRRERELEVGAAAVRVVELFDSDLELGVDIVEALAERARREVTPGRRTIEWVTGSLEERR